MHTQALTHWNFFNLTFKGEEKLRNKQTKNVIQSTTDSIGNDIGKVA